MLVLVKCIIYGVTIRQKSFDIYYIFYDYINDILIWIDDLKLNGYLGVLVKSR